MAWLKAPMGSPALPKAEVLAFSYAALYPSRELLDKYLTEIEKLERGGRISERDHQLLRSSTLAQEELMKLTLGDDAALTEETIMETLERVSAEIKREETKKIDAEAQAHQGTRQELITETAKKNRLQERLYWKCYRSAQRLTQFVGGLVVVLLVLGLLEGIGVRATNWWLGWILMIGSVATLAFSLANFMIGTTVKSIQGWLHEYILNRLLISESKATGISLTEFR
jgi:hypothetical protein